MKSFDLKSYLSQIKMLCLEHQVKTLFAFGSVLTSRFGVDSDIDLIVDIENNDPLVNSDLYFDLKFKIQDLFNRPVDLLEQKAIKNPCLRQEIDNAIVLIYGKSLSRN